MHAWAVFFCARSVALVDAASCTTGHRTGLSGHDVSWVLGLPCIVRQKALYLAYLPPQPPDPDTQTAARTHMAHQSAVSDLTDRADRLWDS